MVLDDLSMDTTDLQIRPHETRPAEPIDVDSRPRSPLLVLAGVTVANVGAVLTVAVGTAHVVVMALGLALFVAGSVTALRFAGPVPSRSTTTVAPSDRPGDGSQTTRGEAGSVLFRKVGASAQLGSDPEQVIGRQTGARI